MVRYTCSHSYVSTFVFDDIAAGRNYMSLSQEIIFLSNQSEVFVRIPLLDNTFPQQPDLFFYVDIVFNRSTIARSVITIVDNDYGELILVQQSAIVMF